jgi:hypothetical protein
VIDRACGGARTAAAYSGKSRDGLARRATVDGVTPSQSIPAGPKWVFSRSKIPNINTLNVRSATGTFSQNAFPLIKVIGNAFWFQGGSMRTRSSIGQGVSLRTKPTRLVGNIHPRRGRFQITAGTKGARQVICASPATGLVPLLTQLEGLWSTMGKAPS